MNSQKNDLKKHTQMVLYQINRARQEVEAGEGSPPDLVFRFGGSPAVRVHDKVNQTNSCFDSGLFFMHFDASWEVFSTREIACGAKPLGFKTFLEICSKKKKK